MYNRSTCQGIFFALIALLIGLHSTALLAQQSAKDTSRTILLKPKLTPIQTITGDSLSGDTLNNNKLISLPGGNDYPFTPEQDSAYYRALRLHTPAGTLAQQHARMYSSAWASIQEQAKRSPWEIARQNLEIPPEYFKPSSQDIAAYNYNIARSQDIPGTLPKTAGAGLQVPLSSIWAFFGLTEDVSPVIRYDVEYSMNVEVVIYSPQARVIAVLLKMYQPTGKYQITWNGRDEKGRQMPTGDYVAEVRLGEERFVRKRIQIP